MRIWLGQDKRVRFGEPESACPIMEEYFLFAGFRKPYHLRQGLIKDNS